MVLLLTDFIKLFVGKAIRANSALTLLYKVLQAHDEILTAEGASPDEAVTRFLQVKQEAASKSSSSTAAPVQAAPKGAAKAAATKRSAPVAAAEKPAAKKAR